MGAALPAAGPKRAGAIPRSSRLKAAGPVGRHAAADTDWKMRAQVLSYSRARGVFAGLELNGAVVKMDRESTLEFYGHIQPVDQTLATANSPTAALPFLTSLSKWAKIASK